LFSSEDFVSFEKEYSLQLRGSKVEIGSVHQIGKFTRVEETHVSFQRKSSILEATASSILFPCEYIQVLK
jgi:hypothetical protein